MSQHSSRGKDWQEIRTRILQRDNYICTYCGNEANEVDHVVPKAAGGTDEDTNLVSSCKQCNGSKQDKQLTRMNYVNRSWLDKL